MTSASPTWTPFRKLEKHFKARAVKGRLPSLRTYPVLDLSRPKCAEDDPVWKAGWWSPANDEEPDLYPNGNERRRLDKGKARDLGERPAEMPAGLDLRAIQLSSGKTGYLVSEGCFIMPGYLSESQQLALLESALTEYTLPPNPLSLSTHYNLPPDLFSRYQARSPGLIQPLFESFSPAQQDLLRVAARARDTGAAVDADSDLMMAVGEILSGQQAWRGDLPAEGLGAKTAEEHMSELRWANLGLIYKWTTKTYDLDPASAIPFPPDLAELCQELIRDVEWSDIFGEESLRRYGADLWPGDYIPDTGIVNFYNRKDTLMGHVDRAELDPHRPLVSISLGHAAIFLLGSNTRDVEPTPIILRSGDVIVMSGKGRENYHGIPRILEGTLPSYFAPADGDSDRLLAAKRWISSGRININARQVYPPDRERSGLGEMHDG